MRCLLTATALLFIPMAVRAEDNVKPNSLTPKEIAEGWILLFDGETTFGWKIEGDAKFKDHILVLGGNKKTAAATTTGFGDFELRFDIDSGGQSATVQFGNSTHTIKTNGWAEVTLKRVGNAVESQSRGAVEASGTGTGGPVTASSIRFEVPAGAQVQLRNVKLKPLSLKSIFNGKDLTGWKKFKGNRRQETSEFGVNDKGELTIKNGPGDLQTTGSWGDFILQIDCLTHGNNLNSGVFFRCQPDKYQQGYEAQIHNGWLDQPKKVKVEEYDPETHKKKGSKEILTKAKDYGTGAIYRRMPARKQAAKDREWFTMTVIAKGRHIATWVNGIQVVDWTDNRPLNNNARNGCRLEAGPISLQGHDPTTNLSFRNIRIAELPKAKPAEKNGKP
jgi:hypothetical protein